VSITPQFHTRVRVEQHDDERWELVAPLRYDSAVLRARIHVDAGYLTDFASVPRLPLAYLLAGNTAHGPAIVHDFLYQTHLSVGRAQADAVFAEAMNAIGVPAWRRGLMWAAVRTAGGPSWDDGPLRFSLLGNASGAAALLPLSG
jgi:hypothetical protein